MASTVNPGLRYMFRIAKEEIVFTTMIHQLTGRSAPLLLGLAGLGLFLCLGCAPFAYQQYAEEPSNMDDVEYLSAYGEWGDVSPFGMVWRPHVIAGWEPFYYGHWVWTMDGWAWVSYEPYGWLVYHYGYWDYEPDLGWFWVPGDTWSPARVEWYTFGDYAGWAPLPPPNVYWPDPWEPFDTNVWIVVDINRFTSENIGSHRIQEPLRRDIIERHTPDPRAPDIGRVQIVTKRAVPVVKIRKEPINIHREAASTPREQERVQKRTEPQFEKIVLPDGQERKVKKYAPEVEREVLAPKKEAPAEQQQPEKKPGTVRKKKTRED
jgi:hypothetical protein